VSDRTLQIWHIAREGRRHRRNRARSLRMRCTIVEGREPEDSLAPPRFAMDRVSNAPPKR